MRERKFRAWDTNRKEMVTEGAFIQVWGNGDYAVYHEDEAEWENQDHIIMQYTGLKDKNGKEIYEGDIVKVEVKYGEYEEDRLPMTICVGKMYGWGSYFEWSDKSGKTDGGQWSMDRTYTNGLEVIGNIYEHPELQEEVE